MDYSGLDRDTTLLQRAPVLAACRDGPVGRSTIAERAGCSRTTAYRATTDLERRGLVEQANGGYRLTGLGSTLLDCVDGFREAVDGARRLRPVLARIDAAELRENTRLFADATVVEADPEAPYAVEQHLDTLIADTSDRICGAATSFGSPGLLARTVERVEAGVEFEWALPTAVLDRLERQHGELHATVLAHDNAAAYVVDDVAVDFSCYDDTLVLTAFDAGRGTLTATATTDDPDAVAWAEEIFGRYRDAGELVA
ncbi:winged helix-turn-helix domain-containing protein [Haloferax sp. ATB1]|uniref:helix-turn-helix transcriptional regulator n=1 Tax=Haloferax sp. ATB1 TaxID=1508454 RepID=UPI0009E210B6|nr:helix-turn-helix domain-containing protein [Haloferax sp. ATB1]